MIKELKADASCRKVCTKTVLKVGKDKTEPSFPCKYLASRKFFCNSICLPAGAER